MRIQDMGLSLARGKRTKDNVWVYGYHFATHTLTGDPCHFIQTLSPDGTLDSYYEVFPTSVGRFIGAFDATTWDDLSADEQIAFLAFFPAEEWIGTPIFTGDVFRFQDEIWDSYNTSCGTEWDSWPCENYGVVGYDESEARFDFVDYRYHENSVHADLHENHELCFVDFIHELKIAGNIFDAPELMNNSQPS